MVVVGIIGVIGAVVSTTSAGPTAAADATAQRRVKVRGDSGCLHRWTLTDNGQPVDWETDESGLNKMFIHVLLT